jgi:hypothetical protein
VDSGEPLGLSDFPSNIKETLNIAEIFIKPAMLFQLIGLKRQATRW